MPRLRVYARSLTRNGDDAEDLLQHAVLKAWKARSSFDPETSLNAWLSTIMRNVFYDLVRSARVNANIDDFTDSLVLARPPSQEAGIELEDLSRALDRLPPPQRQAVMLVGLEGLSYDAVAEQMAVPIGTIRSRVARGRASLHWMLQGEELSASKDEMGR
jgi:RNA polymerase sigma-70 factor (ECF subfamily)